MSAIAATLERSWLGERFRFAEHGTTLVRDTMAGLTTFLVMAYIIFVNPTILSFAGIPDLQSRGLPFNQVLAVTCLVAGVMTIAMGLYTNKAFAIAPGMGLNAVVAFGLVVGEGLSFPAAMGLIVLEGLAVTVLVLTGWREKIFNAIPLELKIAISVGIGIFIMFIGLNEAGIAVRGEGTPLALGSLTTWPVAVSIFGLLVMVAMYVHSERLRRAALLLGIIATTVVAVLINELSGKTAGFTAGATLPDDVYQTPDLSLLGNFNLDAFGDLAWISALVWVFALFMADFFDTMGTLVGVGKQAGYVDERGNFDDVKRPLLVDSLAAVAGGAASSSSATTYIESSAGVAAGGRTGWASVVTGLCFFPFMFFAPIIGMVPPQATAPALILVGILMASVLTRGEAEADRTGAKLSAIDFSNPELLIPVMACIVLMPLTYSIAVGIGAGFILYVLIRTVQGRSVHFFMWLAALAFVLYFLVPLLQQKVL